MNILALCYYAPPQLTPQAIQIGRQLYHLDARVSLLHGHDPRFSDTYDQYPDFFERIKALAVPDPGPLLPRLLQRAAMRLVPRYGRCPDALGRWRRRALSIALAEIAALRPDALASFGMPMSDHLLALELKRRTGLPWLAHFSDPWADNPFHENGASVRRLNMALECQVIAQADRILFTSARTLELVMQKYPSPWRSRAHVLPHAWDLAHFSGPAPLCPPAVAGARHTVRHIGACYGARSPEPLFAALERIHRCAPRLLDAVAFEFIGHVSAPFLASPSFQALPANLVTLRGALPYRSALQLAAQSAALLVIDAPNSASSVFLPSKLVEYIGVRRPVWGITPDGTSADLIAEWAGGAHACAAPDDSDAVERMLTAGLCALARPDGASQACPEHVAARFAAPRVAAALKTHLSEVIAQ